MVDLSYVDTLYLCLVWCALSGLLCLLCLCSLFTHLSCSILLAQNSKIYYLPNLLFLPLLGLFSPKKNVLFPSKNIYYLPLRFILPLFDTYVKGFLWASIIILRATPRLSRAISNSLSWMVVSAARCTWPSSVERFGSFFRTFSA